MARITRRGLLIGGAVAAYLGAWHWYGRRAGTFEFTGIDGLPGWRRVVTDRITVPGSGSATGAVLVGVDMPAPRDVLDPVALCRVLYPGPGAGLRATYFTDVNCPNCPSLEAKVHDRAGMLDIHRLELPLLGRSSEVYARAYLAVGLQDGGAALQPKVRALQRGPRLGRALRKAAQEAGLEPDRLARDMYGPEVETQLELAGRAAATLGVWGTPALTIGGTLVIGDISAGLLDEIIALEATRAPVC